MLTQGEGLIAQMRCRSPDERSLVVSPTLVRSNVVERSHLLLLGGLVRRLVGRVLGGLAGCLLGSLVGRVLGGLAGCLLGSLVGRVLGGLVGRLPGGFVRRLEGSQGDVVAELLQTLDSTAFNTSSVQLIKVVPAQILIGLVVF